MRANCRRTPRDATGRPKADDIDPLVKAIAGIAPAAEIILFGSGARHELTNASDLDFAVIGNGKDGYRRENEILAVIPRNRAIDVVSLTPKIFQSQATEDESLIRNIMREGVTLRRRGRQTPHRIAGKRPGPYPLRKLPSSRTTIIVEDDANELKEALETLQRAHYWYHRGWKPTPLHRTVRLAARAIRTALEGEIIHWCGAFSSEDNLSALATKVAGWKIDGKVWGFEARAFDDIDAYGKWHFEGDKLPTPEEAGTALKIAMTVVERCTRAAEHREWLTHQNKLRRTGVEHWWKQPLNRKTGTMQNTDGETMAENQPRRGGKADNRRPLEEIAAEMRKSIETWDADRIAICIAEAKPHEMISKPTVRLRPDSRTADVTCEILDHRQTLTCRSLADGFKIDRYFNGDNPTISPGAIQNGIDALDAKCDVEGLKMMAAGIATEPRTYANGMTTLEARRPRATDSPGWHRTTPKTTIYDENVKETIKAEKERIPSLAAGSPHLTAALLDEWLTPDTPNLFLGEYDWRRYDRDEIPLSDAIAKADAEEKADVLSTVRALPSAQVSNYRETVKVPDGIDPENGIHTHDAMIGAALSGNDTLVRWCGSRRYGAASLTKIETTDDEPVGIINIDEDTDDLPVKPIHAHVNPSEARLPLTTALKMVTAPLTADVARKLQETLEDHPKIGAGLRAADHEILAESPDGLLPIIVPEAAGDGGPAEPTAVKYARRAMNLQWEPERSQAEYRWESQTTPHAEPIETLLTDIAEAAEANDRAMMNMLLVDGLGACTKPSFDITTEACGDVTIKIGANLADDPIWKGRDLEIPTKAAVTPANGLIITAQTGGTIDAKAIQNAVTKLERRGKAWKVRETAAVLAARPELLSKSAASAAGGEYKGDRPVRITFRRYTDTDTVIAYERALAKRNGTN